MQKEVKEMSSIKEYDVTVGSGIISIFQRQNFKLDRVFSEFIDNSLQSFLDHKEILQKLADGGKCKVSILWDNEKIVITDNSFGMDEEEFGRALKLRAPNPHALNNNQLSVYGMGLKYACVYLGNHYSISSTKYGSNARYYAEIDVPDFEQNNPKTVGAKVGSEPLYTHETIIEITKLRIKKTPEKERDLMKKLGLIYNHYIFSGDLSISVNQKKVVYERPELRPNGEGGSYFESFEDSFVVGDKTYEYTGWIGILNKGNQDDTGLNLIQAQRCIELGYKPARLFGKGNSFQNSRVVGEIVFNGENYILSFNKDKFVWADDGAEDAFITSLLNNSKVAYIIKTSKKMKFTDNGEKIKRKTRKPFEGNGLISSFDETPNPTAQVNGTDKKPNDQSSLITVIQCEKNKYEKYFVEIAGKEIPLYVDIEEGELKGDWLKLEKYENGFLIRINCGNKFINNNFNTQASQAASNVIAIVIVSSMLQSQNLGLKLSDSNKLLIMINKIMGEKNE